MGALQDSRTAAAVFHGPHLGGTVNAEACQDLGCQPKKPAMEKLSMGCLLPTVIRGNFWPLQTRPAQHYAVCIEQTARTHGGTKSDEPRRFGASQLCVCLHSSCLGSLSWTGCLTIKWVVSGPILIHHFVLMRDATGMTVHEPSHLDS